MDPAVTNFSLIFGENQAGPTYPLLSSLGIKKSKAARQQRLKPLSNKYIVLNFFRTNQILAALLYLPYMLPFLAAPWFVPAAKNEAMAAGWLYDRLFGNYANNSTSNSLLVGLSIFILAILVTQLVINRQLDRISTLFAGLFFILFSCSGLSYLNFSPALPGMLFLLLSIRELMSAYKKYAPVKKFFNGGLWLGVAAFFSPAINLLLFWELLLLQRVRTNRQAMDVPAFLLGWLSPNIILGSWLYWQGSFSTFWQQQFVSLYAFQLPPAKTWMHIELMALIVAAILLLFFYRFSLLKKEIGKKRIINSLYELIGFILLIALFFPAAGIPFLQLAAIPLSILFALIFSQIRPQTAEGLHLMMYISVLFALYAPLFKGTIY